MARPLADFAHADEASGTVHRGNTGRLALHAPLEIERLVWVVRVSAERGESARLTIELFWVLIATRAARRLDRSSANR